MKPYITVIKANLSNNTDSAWILWNKYKTQSDAEKGRDILLKHWVDVKIFNRFRKEKDINKLLYS